MTVTIEKPDIISLMYRQERSDSDYGSCLWARFYLDTKNYTMSIESDCGNYSHGWPPTPDHESFLDLLCRMDESYLLEKLADRTVVNGEATFEAMKEMLESEEINLSGDLMDELKEACYHKRTADSVYDDVSSALKYTGLNATIEAYEIYSCVEMDYSSAAKKIVSVFQSAIVPTLKDILARDAEVPTNGDRIRAMSDEELAKFLDGLAFAREIPWSDPFARKFCDNCPTVRSFVKDYDREMEFNECDFVDGKCPNGDEVLWFLKQPAEGDQYG